MTRALLIVDAQVNMFRPQPAHDSDRLLGKLQRLVTAARNADAPVVFVRNNGGEGDPDEPGSPGWDVEPTLTTGEEPIVDKFDADGFSGTNLAEMLRERGVDGIVVAGLQSEYCIQATSRGGVVNGFRVELVSDAHSTYDGDRPATDTIAAINTELAGTVALTDTDTVVAGWSATAAADTEG